jgi:hypothetical protein
MATSNYTPNLHLSAWEASDRPKRADFVSDNTIIDTQLGGHIANNSIHMNADEKAKLNEPFVSVMYAGNGESQRTIPLDFHPKFVFIYKRGVPFVSDSNGVNVVNAACGSYAQGSSVGISVTSTGVTVVESMVSSGIKVSLNENLAQYTLIAFK